MNVSQQRLAHRRIALGVGGGIAAYKVCDLVRLLQSEGATVRVAMTPAAKQFVTPLTLQSLSQHEVLTDYFDVAQETRYGHLHLARWAEAFVIAPATADLLAKIEGGRADDAVTTSLLAFRGPVLLAPAMNTAMWDNEAIRSVVERLRDKRRFSWVGPESGVLADGDVGVGRLAQLPDIVSSVVALFKNGALSKKRVLVTAGPTREPLDAVRFLSNASTGKMGFAMAQAARALGANVTVVAGPVVLSTLPSQGLDIVSVVTAAQMREAVMQRVEHSDYFVATAAVSDFRPTQAVAHKVKKVDVVRQVALEQTVDILLEASTVARSRKQAICLIGFAAETESVERNAKQKLVSKQLDFIVANDVSNPAVGFASESNEVLLLGALGQRASFAGEKSAIAARVWHEVLGTAQHQNEKEGRP
jgi:phosphopantothenoylcysteine decarboxylase / phosphopantothenate---cysteine ligase